MTLARDYITLMETTPYVSPDIIINALRAAVAGRN